MAVRGRRAAKKTASALLDIVNIFGPELNPSLTFKLPASRLIRNQQMFDELQQMKQTAASHNVAYLTANQVQSIYRMFVIHPHIATVEALTGKALTTLNYNRPQDYLSFINPQIVKGEGQSEVEESCLVFPFLKFYVNRFDEVTLKYRNQRREFRQDKFTGIMGQMVQHCISHLDGQIMLDYQISKGRYTFQPDIVRLFPKSSFLLKEYSYRMKDYYRKVNPTQQQVKKWEATREDYLGRIKEQYEKEAKFVGEGLNNKTLKFH